VISAGTLMPAWGQQLDPRQVVQNVILQLQTGSLNPSWYGLQLWQTIALQTNNTGIYPQLVQLGPVVSAQVTQQIQLPTGALYAISVQHANGVSLWQLGISTLTNRIEYAHIDPLPGLSIAAGAAPPSPPPLPSTTPSGTATPAPSGTSPPGTADPTSEACKKFPNLC
jgi:hypothetical protein